MSDDKGLLGNLPRTRPSVESPRRVAAREASARELDSSPAPGAEGADSEPQPGGSGFEQLARAGVGLAGGAFAAGLKLAERAAGEIGRAVGRR